MSYPAMSFLSNRYLSLKRFCIYLDSTIGIDYPEKTGLIVSALLEVKIFLIPKTLDRKEV